MKITDIFCKNYATSAYRQLVTESLQFDLISILMEACKIIAEDIFNQYHTCFATQIVSDKTERPVKFCKKSKF